MEDNKRKNNRCSNNRCSRDGTSRIIYHKSKRVLPSSTINSNIIYTPLNSSLPASLDANTPNDNNNGPNNLKILIPGIVGSLIVLAIIIYCLIRFIRKRKNSRSQEDEEEPHPLKLNFVKHNHPIPELCTTPDTQPILDYYSSKAGCLTNAPSPYAINSTDSNSPISRSVPDYKSTPAEINETNQESPEDNINNEYIPQYYNGIEIPPLGARIIPLERQIQIAKESTSGNCNLSPTNKRKSNRSISSILSISSRRKSSTSNTTINNYHISNNNNNSSATLTLIRETPRNENDANDLSL